MGKARRLSGARWRPREHMGLQEEQRRQTEGRPLGRGQHGGKLLVQMVRARAEEARRALAAAAAAAFNQRGRTRSQLGGGGAWRAKSKRGGLAGAVGCTDAAGALRDRYFSRTRGRPGWRRRRRRRGGGCERRGG